MKAKRADKSQKIQTARQICTDAGTTMTVLPGQENKAASDTKVLKCCNLYQSHPAVEVKLSSVLGGRGGCAKCAKIKGGQNQKRGKAK